MHADDLELTFVPKLVRHGASLAVPRTDKRALTNYFVDPARAFATLAPAARALASEARCSDRPGLVCGVVSRSGRLLAWRRSSALRFGADSLVIGSAESCDVSAAVRGLSSKAMLVVQALTDVGHIHTVPLQGRRSVGLSLRHRLPAVIKVGPVACLVLQTPWRETSLDWLEEALQDDPDEVDCPTRAAVLGFDALVSDERSSLTRTLDPKAWQALLAGRSGQQRFSVTHAMASQTFLIGRGDECDGPTEHTPLPRSLSRRHAVAFVMRGGYYLADTASTQGLWHDKLGPLRLRHLRAGDAFSLGDLRLRVHSV